jgi:hypothetical protein
MNWKDTEGLNGRPKFWEEPQQGNPGNDPVLQLSQQRESAAKEEFRGKRAWSWQKGLISSGGVAEKLTILGLGSSGSASVSPASPPDAPYQDPGYCWYTHVYSDVVWNDADDHTIPFYYLTVAGVSPLTASFDSSMQGRSYSSQGPSVTCWLEWVTDDLTVKTTQLIYYMCLLNGSSFGSLLSPEDSSGLHLPIATIDALSTGVRLHTEVITSKMDTTYYLQDITWDITFEVILI